MSERIKTLALVSFSAPILMLCGVLYVFNEDAPENVVKWLERRRLVRAFYDWADP